jgi:dihydrodipicolinate synthase/N-acetylneuraminate lyase
MSLRSQLLSGLVIPAHPLALNRDRRLDERRQRALTRYYLAAGAGGIAVGVHTTQFAVRDPAVGLFEPVLRIAMEEMRATSAVKIAGVCGKLPQAISEATIAARLGYDAVLLSLGALPDNSIAELIQHCREISSIVSVIGFYLQPSVGGRVLPYAFWREFCEIENVVAIKVAPFSRYQTLEVVRAFAESGRTREIALYTGNDDNILLDLLSVYDFRGEQIRFAGGLLGHWAVWTKKAAELLREVKKHTGNIPPQILTLAQQVTESNAALFDPSHQFRGCVPGIHEILRRQGFLEGRWCLDPHEDLSPGQMEEIDRVCEMYPQLQDNEFVRTHLHEWLR